MENALPQLVSGHKGKHMMHLYTSGSWCEASEAMPIICPTVASLCAMQPKGAARGRGGLWAACTGSHNTPAKRGGGRIRPPSDPNLCFNSNKGGQRVKPNENELSEGVGGTFGRLTLFHTATYKELLDCIHSKAHNFKKGE